MSQHDLDIANQTASAARADINLAFKALGSTNSGSSAPATTYANMLWYDTSANILKIRSEADDAWISIGYLDQAADSFSVFDDTKLVNSSGNQVGLLGDQATATWEGGTGTLDSLVSPANVKAAVIATLAGVTPSVGAGSLLLAKTGGASSRGVVNVAEFLIVQGTCTLSLSFDTLVESSNAAVYTKILVNGTAIQTYTSSNDGTGKTLNVSLSAGDILATSALGRTQATGPGGDQFEYFTSNITNLEVRANSRAYIFNLII